MTVSGRACAVFYSYDRSLYVYDLKSDSKRRLKALMKTLSDDWFGRIIGLVESVAEN